jgi:hypothetical protein
MSSEVKHRRGTKTEIDGATLAIAEIGMETTRKKFRFGDGLKQGGFRLQRENWRDSAAFDLGANTNDWSPTAFEELGVLLVNPTVDVLLTGLVGGIVGRDIEIRVEAAATKKLTIGHQNAASAAANRFNTVTGKNIVLNPGQSAFASYDAVNSRWLCRTVNANQTAIVPVGVQQNADVQAVVDALANRLPQIIARSILAPPGAPVNGDTYIVPAAATGAWAGQTDNIATWSTNVSPAAWQFTVPTTNQYVISYEDQRLLTYQGGWILPRINFYLSNELTPSAIAADIANYAPAGLYGANVVRFSTDQAGRKISGIAGGDAGQYKVFFNAGANPTIFTDEDAASTAGNRLALGMNITVRKGESITLRYDATVSRWVMIARGVLTYNEFQSEIFLTGSISPAIAASQNNWAPAGIANANTVYLALTANANITGIGASTEGREISFFNTTAFTATFKEQSSSSTAANRFAFGGDLVVPPNTSTTLRYNAALGRWIIKSAPSTIALAAAVAAITAGSAVGVSDTLVNVLATAQASAAAAQAAIDAIKVGSTAGVSDTLANVLAAAQASTAAVLAALNAVKAGSVAGQSDTLVNVLNSATSNAAGLAIALG